MPGPDLPPGDFVESLSVDMNQEARGRMVARTSLAAVILCAAFTSAGNAQFWDKMTNPKVTLEIEHPPALPLRVTRIAFGQSKGPETCIDSLQARVEEDFVTNGVELVDRSQLDSVIAEHRLQGSALFDQKAATEVGKLLGAQALVYLQVHQCRTDRTQSQRQSLLSTKPVIVYNTSGVVRGSLKTVDLTTGRVLTAKSFEGRYAEEAQGGYPSESAVQEQAERIAAARIHALFFPWKESKTLVFYDDEDCNLEAAHGLLQGLDFDGALRQSLENLEACKALQAAKPKPRLLAKAYYNLGVVQFLKQSYGEALANFNEASRLNSSDIVSAAMADCRQAQQIAEEMSKYETDQAAFLEAAQAQDPPAAEAKAAPAMPAGAKASDTGSRSTPAKAAGAASAPASSPEERLQQLEKLYQKKLITKEEYDKKRAQILSEI